MTIVIEHQWLLPECEIRPQRCVKMRESIAAAGNFPTQIRAQTGGLEGNQQQICLSRKMLFQCALDLMGR